MDPDTTIETQATIEESKSNIWTTVTPFSKYAALLLFILLPFAGGWIGYQFAPVEVVEIEKVVIVEKEAEDTTQNNPTDIGEAVFVATPETCVRSLITDADERLECIKHVWSLPDEYGYIRYSYFPEQITLSGTYKKYLYGESAPEDLFRIEGLHFLPNEEDFSKLPESQSIPKDWQLNFRDESIEELFGVEMAMASTSDTCVLSGEATIKISEMVVGHTELGVPLWSRVSVDVDTIVSKENYVIECG